MCVALPFARTGARVRAIDPPSIFGFSSRRTHDGIARAKGRQVGATQPASELRKTLMLGS